jgi:hypothetical protein
MTPPQCVEEEDFFDGLTQKQADRYQYPTGASAYALRQIWLFGRRERKVDGFGVGLILAWDGTEATGIRSRSRLPKEEGQHLVVGFGMRKWRTGDSSRD